MARKALIAAALLLGLAPASASAYTVTIHVHGAGVVSEIVNRTGGTRDIPGCTIGPTGTSNASTTDCVMGSASGLWNWGDVVRLGESVDATQVSRGWHFDHWTDSSADGSVNCDPQSGTGDFSSPTYCEFAIFDNLQVNLWFKDSAGPQDTAISGGPTQGSTTSSTSAQFTSFSAPSDPDATFQCKLDPPGTLGSWGTCPRYGAAFSGLTQNGTWQLNVRAVDPSGNLDLTPASRTWVVDTTPPVVNLTNGPAQNTTTRTPTADFNVSTSDGSLVCTIDGATVSTCTPPSVHIPALADGTHTFSVRGVDAAGNTSTPLTRTWTVDTTPPTVSIGGGPTGTTDQSSATFTVTTSDGTPTCTLDGAATPCAGAHNNLANGSHSFTATATDAVGNTSAPVSRTWTVDAAVPDVTLLSGPAAGSTDSASSATFTFSSTTASATYQCKLDLASFAPCTSPTTLAGLPNGDHTFSVRALDTAGNSSPTVSRTWTVNNKDQDHDGYDTPTDCNDANAAIHPGANDIPDDGIDQDCTGKDAHNADQDGDGVVEGPDCNDHNAAIHPGATDIPGDGIDQDCDGKDATLSSVPGGIRYQFSTHGTKTTIVVLKLSGLTGPRTSVTISCKGAGCKLRSLTAKLGQSHTLDVRKLLRNLTLKAGQTLTIRISAPGFRSKTAKFTMRSGKLPKGGAFGPA